MKTLQSTKEKQPILTIDTQNNLLRIHKSTLNILNNPDYVQLFINPSEKIICISAGNPNDYLTHRIDYDKLKSGKSYELYSTPFIRQLKNLFPNEANSIKKRIIGEYLSKYNVTLFNFNNDRPEHYEAMQ